MSTSPFESRDEQFDLPELAGWRAGYKERKLPLHKKLNVAAADARRFSRELEDRRKVYEERLGISHESTPPVPPVQPLRFGPSAKKVDVVLTKSNPRDPVDDLDAEMLNAFHKNAGEPAQHNA